MYARLKVRTSPIDSNVLTFGTIEPNASYQERPSAYVVAGDDRGGVAVVSTNKAFYLPGGGLIAGETPEAAAKRETVEETGFEVKLLRYLGRADEFLFVMSEKQHLVKRCHFFLAQVLSRRGLGEDDHELLWLSPKEAVRVLTHGSQRWAVTEHFHTI